MPICFHEMFSLQQLIAIWAAALLFYIKYTNNLPFRPDVIWVALAALTLIAETREFTGGLPALE